MEEAAVVTLFQRGQAVFEVGGVWRQALLKARRQTRIFAKLFLKSGRQITAAFCEARRQPASRIVVQIVANNSPVLSQHDVNIHGGTEWRRHRLVGFRAALSFVPLVFARRRCKRQSDEQPNKQE
jgi:hypothetical protein